MIKYHKTNRVTCVHGDIANLHIRGSGWAVSEDCLLVDVPLRELSPFASKH